MAGKLRTLGAVYHTSCLEIKEVAEDGIFTGYASVFSKDSDGDVIMKGAFLRTIKNRGGKVPILWQHDKTKPIGLNLEMKEDSHGLLIKGQLNMDTQLGREARSLVQQGAIKGLSIGFYITQAPEYKEGIRYIKEVNLVEYSVVTFPANEDAQVEGIKGVGEMKGSTDFNAVLAQQQAEADMWEEKYEAQSALGETIYNILGEGEEEVTVDKTEAIKAISETYVSYTAVMVNWWSKYIDIMCPTAKSAGSPDEKAKAKIETAIKRYKAAHSEARTHAMKSMEKHQKAIDMVDQMVYSHLITGGDRNAPNPLPKGNPPLPLSQVEHLPVAIDAKDAKSFFASAGNLFK